MLSMREKVLIIDSFSDFYPAYLEAHSNLICRRFHFLGTSAVVSILLLFFFTGAPMLLLLLPIVGYSFAWVGHFFYEKNNPMTLKYPLYSLIGDFRMFWDILCGKVSAF